MIVAGSDTLPSASSIVYVIAVGSVVNPASGVKVNSPAASTSHVPSPGTTKVVSCVPGVDGSKSIVFATTSYWSGSRGG